MNVNYIFLLLVAVTNVTFAPEQPVANWQLLGQNEFISAYVERTLYHDANAPGFFVHFRIDTKTRKKLAVDLCNDFDVIYPNQWGFYEQPHRDIVDEERLIPKQLDLDRQRKLLADFRADKLTPIAESVDYYRQFFGDGPERKDPARAQYLIVSTDGQLIFTDGHVAMTLRLADATDTRDVVIILPIEWKIIPRGARVLAWR